MLSVSVNRLQEVFYRNRAYPYFCVDSWICVSSVGQFQFETLLSVGNVNTWISPLSKTSQTLVNKGFVDSATPRKSSHFITNLPEFGSKMVQKWFRDGSTEPATGDRTSERSHQRFC